MEQTLGTDMMEPTHRAGFSLQTLVKLVLYGFLFYLFVMVMRFTMVALSPVNFPYLTRTIVQSLECCWVIVLLLRIFRGGSLERGLFERRMLVTLWALYGLWLVVLVPWGMRVRSPLLFPAADTDRYASFLPFLPTFEFYLLVLWLIAGIGGAILYLFKRRFANVDEVLLPAAFYAVGQGLVLLARFGPDLARANRQAMMQSIFFVLGCVLAGVLLVPSVRERLIAAVNYPYLLLLGALGLIGVTFVFGTALSGGKALWLVIGGVSFQPVEPAKVLFVLVMGVLLERHAFQLQRRKSLAAPLTFVLVCACFFVLLFLQRDFGPILLLMLTVLCMYLTVSRQWFILPTAVALGALMVWICLETGQPAIVYARLMDAFDPLGHSGQLTAGLWAQGSGGTWGTGLGMSKVTSVPIVASDYIYSAIVAEKGFVGAATFLLLWFGFCWRILQLGLLFGEANQRDGTFLVGLACAFFIQAFIIIAGNLAITPLTGITLPLVSAGGTSLVINLGMLALVLAFCARHTYQDALR